MRFFIAIAAMVAILAQLLATPASAAGDYESLGGELNAQPECITWGPGHIDCFVLWRDGTLRHRFLSSAGWRNDWENLGGQAASKPSCVSWGSGHIDCFVRWSDNTMRHRWFGAPVWHDWQNRGGNLASEPICVSMRSGRIDCMAQFRDQSLQHITFDNQTWGTWKPVPGTNLGDLALWQSGGLSCVPSGGSFINCAARWADNTLRVSRFDSYFGPAWSAWQNLGMSLLARPACLMQGINFRCFVQIMTPGVGIAITQPETNNAPVVVVGFPRSNMDCLSWTAGHIDCFAAYQSRQLYHIWSFTGGSSWTEMTDDFPPIAIKDTPECISWGSGHIDCFVRLNDDKMYHRWFDGSRWRP